MKQKSFWIFHVATYLLSGSGNIKLPWFLFSITIEPVNNEQGLAFSRKLGLALHHYVLEMPVPR